MKIAIQANPSRGKEIISLLKSLGGIDTCWDGDGNKFDYYIDENHIIQYDYAPVDYKVYTLEEFEKEFPFKIGDIVTIGGYTSYKVITLENFDNKMCYKLDNGFHYIPQILKLYRKMKKEINVTLTLDKAKEWYKKGGELKEIALQAYSEEELAKVDLPKTWEEFYQQYEFKHILNDCLSAVSNNFSMKYVNKFEAFVKLQYLRDCWRQGWEPKEHEPVDAIKFSVRELAAYQFNSREFLSFPTKEMAEEFLECFKDLIEQAGDLI